MPVPNPEYKPNWEEIHDHHNAEFDRLMDLDLDDRDENTQAQIDYHLGELQSAVSCYQHETIQDMAKWVFDKFDPARWAVLEGGDLVNQFDFEKFTTRDEVNTAYREAADLVDMIKSEQRKGMETGRPEGLNIFEETGKNTVQIQWQHFSNEELFRGGWFGNGVITMVSIDQRDGEFHICFSEAHKITGASATNTIENLATAMYRRISDNLPEQTAQQPQSGWKNLRSRLTQAVTGNTSEPVRPEQFHFYLHQGPYSSIGESFGPVNMQFRDGAFHNPEFGHYEVMPEAIQKAHRESRSNTIDVSSVPVVAITDQTDGFDHRG